MQPNQWQQPYQGYGFVQQPNFPQQTGAPGGMGNPSFLNSQSTGFPNGGMQSMQTGFQHQRPSPGLAPAQTGMQPGGGGYSFLNQPPPSSFRPSGLAPQMTGYPGGGASGLMPQQTGFMGGGMMSQPTGMGMMSQPTGMTGLRPQPTGFIDPRLQTMTQSFMPSNMSQPFAPSGAPVFNPTPQNQPLANTFQSLLQNPTVKTPKVPWTLSKQEKKDYDQIFRAWEKGDGFISGETAREVFGQSGLGQDDLMKIWTLSDVGNRGKLNLPEFHVAMGLIYRALNGNEIPDKLPEELVPASMRDIDTTVNFMRDLLRHEANTRSDTSSPSYTQPAAASRDASSYKHSDAPASSTYRPSSRHLDRKAVRYAGEEADADIKDIRRQLQNTSDLLSRTAEDSKRKSAEDEALEQEIEDLKYKVKRIQEDIEYVSKGRRTADKDEERRKLERELLFLMHEKLPELERRQEQREEEKRMEERAGVRARDQRNESHGRYGRYDDHAEDRDRDWLRGTYDRERPRDREYGRRDSRERSRDREYDRYERDSRSDRPPSPPAARFPAPVPPSAPATASSAPPPPKPTSSAAQTKNMTPEERTAFIREQAQRRIQERLKALGVDSGPVEEPAVDKSVEDRLAEEKKEAEERAKKADAEQAAREHARQARLTGSGGAIDASPAPAEPPKSILKKAGPPAPPPSKGAKQPPAPPAPRGAKVATPTAAAPPVVSRAVQEDPEEAELRRREEAIAKAKEERRRRLAELEAEEEAERKQEEARRTAKSAVSFPPPEAAKSTAAEAVSSPPPAPDAPPPPASGGGHNPFLKPHQSSSTAATTTPSGGFNPFFRPPATAQSAATTSSSSSAAPTPSVDAPPPPPAPPAPPALATQAPRAAQTSVSSDSWEEVGAQEIEQHDSDDSSDDDYANSRMKRSALAGALFGNLGGGGGSRPPSAPPAAPPAPKAPPAALAKLGGGTPAPGGGMNALLGAIQSGARLRKAETVDKSGPPVSGRVIGDAEPPAHISSAPSLPSPTTQPKFEEDLSTSANKRQSVDWYAGLAADQSHPAASFGEYSQLETTAEEEEPKTISDVPDIAVQDTSSTGSAGMDDFDITSNIRARTLFAYDGQRDVDLTFKEDVVMVCHPAKDPSSDWWYGMLVNGGEKGWVPKAYVEEIKVTKAKASYSYTGGSESELPFAEGDVLDIVDSSDPDWWKTEKAGAIFLVPASYLEIVDGPLLDKPPPQSTDTPTMTTIQKVPQQKTISSHPVPSPVPSTSHLSPTFGTGRPRSSSLQRADASAEESSSDDSVLSWWSSDDESESEPDEERNAERQRREDERKKILSAAGLQLRREPPGIPARQERKPSRRRPAPAAPKRRRNAPAVPTRLTSESETPLPATPSELADETDTSVNAPLATGDAYARYEEYLAQARARPPPSPRPNLSRPTSQVTSPQLSGTAIPPSPSASSMNLSSSLGGRESGGRLSGFLSRMIGPTTGHSHGLGSKDENRKSISSPITRVATEDGPNGSSESDFGKTWSSLVDHGVLDSMSSRERKRQEAIFEFIATEATYNRDLQLIVEAFYAPLLSILDDKALAVIFANVEDILLANTSFYSALEQRQKACRLYVDVIGDVLADNMGNMGVYMTYCVNQQQANQLLQTLRSENAALAEHLQNVRDTNPAVRGLDLSSFLLIPMQRITRYPLLIKQIIHYTESDQDLLPLQKALHTVEGIVAQINESVRAAEGQERLRVLSEDLWIGGEGRLDLTAPTQYQGQRRLLKEGQVTKAKSGRKLTLVLCNDVLVLIESRNLYRMPIPLFEVTVREGRDDSVFQLKVAHRRGGDTVGLKAASPREAKEWIAQIEKARLLAIDARKGEATRSVGGGFAYS